MATNADVDMAAFTFGEYLSSLNEDGGRGIRLEYDMDPYYNLCR